MTDEKKSPAMKLKKKKEGEPQVEVVEEPILLPINVVEFEQQIRTSLKGVRFAREALGLAVVYEEFRDELNIVDEALCDILKRVKQLNELEDVLSSTQFTTQPETDARIRKKVIEAITQNFRFVRVDETEPTAVIVEKPQQVSQEQISQEVSTRSVAQAASTEKMRRQARAEAVKEMGPQAPPGANMYLHAFKQDSANVDLEGGSDEYDENVTQEDLATFFGDQNLDPEILAKADSLKAKVLKSGPAPIRGKNKGIQRRI